MSDELLAERYKLVRRIGEGGYGTVWLARDEQLRRDVALKRLSVQDRSRKESQKKSDRFRHEAITMAKIDHPNVVTIYDVGELEESQELFLVMELLEGRSLLEELATVGPLDHQRALSRFIETLEGLQAAHDVGVVHKDLKPANLFLHRVDTPRERMKLIDFGIARMDSLTKLTGTGRMAGSPRYLAPEYIMGESVTAAIDIYQVALILVEAITGTACIPRGLEYFAICERHILSQLDVPDDLLASPLGPVLERALQRQPGDRYASAEQFAAELRKIRPEELPDYTADETVRMSVPNFDDVEVPSSEETVSGMVDQLRREEAAKRPTAQTKRYAGVRKREESEDDTTTVLQRSGPLPSAPQAPAAAPAADVPPLPPRQDKDSPNFELWVIAGVVTLLAIVIVAGGLVIRGGDREPIIDAAAPPSVQTCMLQCTQWYQDREVRGECQALCRGKRPPTEPPFPLIDEVEPQYSEEEPAEDDPALNDTVAPAPEPEVEPEPEPETELETTSNEEVEPAVADKKPSRRKAKRAPKIDWVAGKDSPSSASAPEKFRPKRTASDRALDAQLDSLMTGE